MVLLSQSSKLVGYLAMVELGAERLCNDVIDRRDCGAGEGFIWLGEH